MNCFPFIVLLSGVSAAPDDEIVRRWTFDSAADLEGWEAGDGVGDLRVTGGRLSGRLTRPDAYVFAPPLRAPMDGLVMRVRWSCSQGGSGQCYFATERSPVLGEDKVLSKSVPGGSTVETEFPLDRGGREPEVLTRFRLDPFNGAEGAEFEIDDVALIRLAPVVEVEFGPERSLAKVREPIKLQVLVRHRGGGRISGILEAEVDYPAESRRRVSLDGTAKGPQAVGELAFDKAGVHPIGIRVHRDGRLTHDLESEVIVDAPSTPGKLALEGEGMALEILPSGPGGGARAARLWARGAGGWKAAGLLLPLVEVAVEEDGVVRRSHPALSVLESDGRRLRLASNDGKGSFKSELTLGFEPGRGGAKEDLVARVTLNGPMGARLLKLSGPTVRRVPLKGDPLDRFGLFGGVEFLEPGWSSSSDKAVGPKFADRWTPHPLKVCLPVMAIEEDGVTTAVLWDPLEEWAPGRRLPAATFASPDFLEGRPEHLLQLFVPSAPELVDENGTLARRPFVLGEEPVKLSMAIHAVAGGRAVEAARWWYDRFGIPAPPPAPHDDRVTHDLIARSYGETVWWPEDKGWRHHWFLDKSSSFRPDMAAELLLHAKRTGERRWIDATGLDLSRSLIETAGTLWDRAAGSTPGAGASARAMRDDGTYAYHDSPAVKETTRRHTGGLFDTLGEDNSTSLGTCVQGAMPLFHHVLLTGDPSFTDTAEKALRAMRRFRVPRGAQVWEVHQQIPDIRAAALAVEAFRIGYLVTGDAAYLDDARYWANAGLPFLYTWRTPEPSGPATVRTSRDRTGASKSGPLPAAELFREPRRQVNPYGTIPVLGTTFYVMSWFGVIVQWCGLEWAWKVLELCDVRDDRLLRAAAEGVIRSGLQQTFDREPWTGLYPDVWNVEENWAGGALICPHLTVQSLRAAGRIPQELRVWTRRAGPGREAPIVHGWGTVADFEATPEKITVSLRFLENEPCEVLVARSDRPRSVTRGGKELREVEVSPAEREGWRFDPGRRLLGIRFTSPGKETAVSIGYR